MGVVLTAARRFSSSLCLPPEEREGDSRGEREEERNFVEMLADLFFSFIQDPQKFTKLYLALQETCAATTDSSVATILGKLQQQKYSMYVVFNSNIVLNSSKVLSFSEVL